MKSKLLLAITVGLFFFSAEHNAQVSAYSFTQTSGTYGAPNSGSFVGLNDQDDDVTPATLPFPFIFNGVSQTTIDVCSNGYLSFNALTGTEYYPISDPSTQNVISPFGDDIIMGTFITGNIAVGSNSITNCSSVAGFSVGNVLNDIYGDFNSNPTITSIVGNVIVLNQSALFTVTNNDFLILNGFIKQNVSGVTPNRICEFEFVNFTRYFIYDENINFKLKLYETSNKIEFVYGSMTPGFGNTFPEIGLKGNTNSDFNSREVISPVNWSNSTAATTSSASCEFDNLTFPASGQSYMWTPPSCTVPVLAVTPASTVICEGQSLQLTASGATTYSWTNGPATAQNTVTPTTTTTYTLIGANLTCTTSIDYTVTVAPKPVLSVTSSNSLVCAGQSATLSGSGATSYTWANGPSAAQHTVTPTSATVYTLTGSNGTCTNTFNYTQNVAPSPTITISQSSVACEGVMVDLIASGASSYSWALIGSLGATLTISPQTTAPTYTVYGTTGSCTSSATIAYSFIPAPMLTPVLAQSTICVGEKATFSLSGSTAGLTFNWANGANTTSSAVVTATAAPSIALSVVASNGTCQATYSFIQAVSECTGLNEASAELNKFITAYPNPFNSSLSLRNSKEEEVSVVILDALGKVVLSSKLKGGADETISTESLKSGLYFISVKGSNGTYTEKLIKE